MADQDQFVEGDLSDAENPLLDSLPDCPKSARIAMEGLRAIACERPSIARELSFHEQILLNGRSVFVPTITEGQILQRIIAAMYDSYRERDWRLKAYRELAFRANRKVHKPLEVRRGLLPPQVNHPTSADIARAKPVRVPNVRARGLIIQAPLRMGRRALVGLIENAIGAGHESHVINTPNGALEATQVKVLRVKWPLDGTLKSLAYEFAAALDRATGVLDQYARLVRNGASISAFHEDVMTCLTIIASVGLVIVEQINVNSAARERESWDALARLTNETGVVIVCVMTPAAASNGLAQNIGARGPLSTLGEIELLPPAHDDAHWVDVCESQYIGVLRPITGDEMPPWFPPFAHEICRARRSLVSVIVNHVAMVLAEFGLKALDEVHFKQYAVEAIRHYAQALDAVDLARREAQLTPTTLKTFGDMFTSKEARGLCIKPQLEGKRSK